MKSVSLVCLAIFVIVSLASAAKIVFEPRIVNGQDAKEGQFPHMASLQSRIIHAHFCGASILSGRFLLTAAHCCQSLNAIPKNVVAVVGALRKSSGGVAIELDTITAHKGFNYTTAKYDVAVLRTATEIIFTDLIQPIALPKANLPADKSIPVVLCGWGRHKFPSSATPDILQYSALETISLNECEKRFANIPILRDMLNKENVCTIDKRNGGACHGDSGSGLVDLTDPNQKTVVGIASWVFPCARGYPDVFTDVFSHLNWIKEQIESQSGNL